MNKDFLHKISENMHGFSKGQKRIGNFILSHYDKAAFMTAAKLGESVGVSESTVSLWFVPKVNCTRRDSTQYQVNLP